MGLCFFSLEAKETLNITGSSLAVTDALTLNAAEINITAGVEESSSHSSSHTTTTGVSVSTSGAKGFDASQQMAAASGGLNASTNSSESDSYSKTHIHSLITAGSLSSNSERLNIIGGDVEIQNDINITTKELTIASVQDESRSSSSSSGFNISGGGQGISSINPSSVGVSHNESNSDSKWVNNQSSLIGGLSGNGAVNITADKTTFTGALLASATRDETGTLSDNGNLNLTTEVLEVNNLYDHNTSDSRGINLSVGTGWSGDNTKTPEKEGYASGSSTLGLNHSGHNTQQTSFATLGGGTVQKKDGTAHDVATVNSDLNNTQEITQDQDTGGLDASFTLDHRLTTKEGREDIRQDFEDTNNHFNKELLGGLLEGIKTGDVGAGIDAIGRKIDLRNGITAIQADSSTETEEQLNAIDGDAASKQEGIQALSDYLTGEAGVTDQQMLVYMDENDAAAGIHNNEGNLSGVNAARTDMTNGEDVVQVAVHETTHHILNEQNNGYNDADREYAASNDGDYAKELWAQQNRRNGNVTGGSAQDIANWNANNKNSALVQNNTVLVQDIAPQGSAQREEFIPLLIIGGIKLAEFAFTAYEAKQLKDAYDRGEITNDDLAKMAATSAATSAAGIIPVPASSAVAKIFAKAAGRMENRAAARVEKSVADVNPEQAGGGAGKMQSAEMPDGDTKGVPPPNLSPPGAGRTGAFKEAKRQSGIPTSQQPSNVGPNLDKRGNVQPGKLYEFEVPASGGGTKTVKIRDDAGGHDFGPGNAQNRGSHFNNEAGDHFDY